MDARQRGHTAAMVARCAPRTGGIGEEERRAPGWAGPWCAWGWASGRLFPGEKNSISILFSLVQYVFCFIWIAICFIKMCHLYHN